MIDYCVWIILLAFRYRLSLLWFSLLVLLRFNSRYTRYRVMRTPPIYCVYHSLIFRQIVQLLSGFIRLNQGAQAIEDIQGSG